MEPSKSRAHAAVPLFAEYIRDTQVRAALAAQLGRSPDYLYQIGAGIRRASGKLSKAIERETFGRVPRHVLRSDLFDAPPPDRAA